VQDAHDFHPVGVIRALPLTTNLPVCKYLPALDALPPETPPLLSSDS
jgi:hypothetical protein